MEKRNQNMCFPFKFTAEACRALAKVREWEAAGMLRQLYEREPGLLPKAHIEAEAKRLVALRNKLRNRLRVYRSRDGVLQESVHPLARGKAPRGQDALYTRRGLRKAPPCWRQASDDPDNCSAGQSCSVYRAAVARWGKEAEGSEAVFFWWCICGSGTRKLIIIMSTQRCGAHLLWGSCACR